MRARSPIACAQAGDPRDALKAYEAARREATGKVVRTNREHPPDFINIKVEELTGDRPFDNLDDFITQDELRALCDKYKRIAGFAVKRGVNLAPTRSVTLPWWGGRRAERVGRGFPAAQCLTMHPP